MIVILNSMKNTKKFPFWGIDRTLSKSTYLSWDEKAVLMLLFAIYYSGREKPYSKEPKIEYIQKTLGLTNLFGILRLEDKGLIHLNRKENTIVDFEFKKIEKLGLVEPGYFDNWD